MSSALKKIVVIGPESTGKSTLSCKLALALGTVWVPEYARAYLEPRQNNYDYEDLLTIAKGQIGLEESLQQEASRYLVCDTDLYVLKVWCEHRYNTVHAYILEMIATRKYDSYILCDIDMPWSEDPLREYPDPLMRDYFYRVYKDIVVHSGRPFLIVSGNEAERLQQALNSPLIR